MKRNAKALTYYYHVVKTDNGYKVKRSLFHQMNISIFCASSKDKAEKHISLLIQSKSINGISQT